MANSFMILGFQGFPQNSLSHRATIVLFSCVIRSSLLAAAHSKQAQHNTNHPISEFVCGRFRRVSGGVSGYDSLAWHSLTGGRYPGGGLFAALSSTLHRVGQRKSRSSPAQALSSAFAIQVSGPGEKQRTNKMPFSFDSHTTAPPVGLSRTTGPSQIKCTERRSDGSTRLRW